MSALCAPPLPATRKEISPSNSGALFGSLFGHVGADANVLWSVVRPTTLSHDDQIGRESTPGGEDLRPFSFSQPIITSLTGETGYASFDAVNSGAGLMMKRIFVRNLVAVFAGVLSLGFSIGTIAAAPIDDFNALVEDYWSFELQENPFAATGSGVFEYNDRVPQIKPEDYARRTKARQEFLDRLEAIDSEQFGQSEHVSAELLHFILENEIALSHHKPWRIPFLADTGFHTNFGYTVSATPFREEKDYLDYIARLKAFAGFLDQNVENMKIGLAEGFSQPKEILPLIMPSFEAQVTESAEDHPLFTPFMEISGVSKLKARSLRKRGKAALEKDVIPAYERVFEFMKTQYAEGASDTLGASAREGGSAHYSDLIAYYTTLDDVTAEEIHALGLLEVARIRKEMNKVIEETGFDGDFKAFQDFLRSDPQFYAKTEQQLLNHAAWVSKDIDGKLPAFFGKLPRQPYSVEPVPASIAPNYTTGRYVGASASADRGGQYWVNTYALDKRPLYAIPALTLHEAVPGHHLQAALALEIENVPEFRKQFYPHAFGEGWGLYAEKLGVEMDIYKTPYDHFGRLSYEMWRACRLVIDTGLHSQDWPRQQAMDYLADNTVLSLHNVQTEVDRYIAWPGQALAYKMGELTLWELRAKAENELGDDFDIRAFHDAVLTNGGLPLGILREQIDNYILQHKSK